MLKIIVALGFVLQGLAGVALWNGQDQKAGLALLIGGLCLLAAQVLG